MVIAKGRMDPGVLAERQSAKRARASEREKLHKSSLGKGLTESPILKESRTRRRNDTTEEEDSDARDPPAKKKAKSKANNPRKDKKASKSDSKKRAKKNKKNESSSGSDSDSDSGSGSDSDETATKLIPQLLELLKKDKTKRKKKKSKKEKKKRKKHKKDSEDEESEDEKVAQKFIQSASRKPTPCSTKRRDPVEAQLNAQKRAKGVRFGINTMSFMVLLPKNYDKNTKGNDRGGMCRLVELVRGANRHGGASRAGAE